MKVAALLVSHNGARWLPAVLSGIAASAHPVDELICLDTGSTDASPALIEQATGRRPISLPSESTWAAAVRAGLDALPPARPDEWVWLLHDDANPDPACLGALVAAADRATAQTVALGPKLREWPSLRRLLEVGVTISGTGRRETGLEPGEYDQGQHDEDAVVLAVNTAGMLVRRDALEQVGFDDRLPIYGNDIDFGWRLARHGFATMVVTEAVMFHAEAAHRGQRDARSTIHPRREERAAAIQTLLTHSAPGWLAPRAVRLFLGSLLRALGYLLVRAPAEAREEVAALALVLRRTGRVLAGRRAHKRAGFTTERDGVRPLLAPAWMPLRHGLDFLTEIGEAASAWMRELLGRREDDEHLAGRIRGRTLGRRLASSPVLWTLAALTLLAIVAARHLLGPGPLHGGALLAAPDGAGRWWSLWVADWHWLGTGSAAAAPAYVLPLALAGTALLGKAGMLVWLLFAFSVPLTFCTAWMFLRSVVNSRITAVWGAAAYALTPVLAGATHQGRLGTVAGAILLPIVARAATGLASESAERRARARWRTALALGVLVAFVPAALILAIAVAALARLFWPRVGPVAAVTVLIAPVLLSLPWALGTLAAPGSWFVEAGRADVLPVDPTFLEVLTGRSGGAGSAPAWLSVGLLLAALLALLRPDTRVGVGRAWALTGAAALVVALLGRVAVSLPGISGDFAAWPGFGLVALQAGLILAVCLGADGAPRFIADARSAWLRPVAAAALLAAAVTPLLGAGWWAQQGIEDPLVREPVREVPTYMTDLAERDDRSAILVLRGGEDRAVEYSVLRGGALRLGEDGVVAVTAPSRAMTAAVSDVLGGVDGSAQLLGHHGIRYVYAPRPVSTAVTGGFDAAEGFSGASAPTRGTRAWQVDAEVDLGAIEVERSWTHALLLGGQVLAIVVVVVMAMPSRRRR